MGAPHTFDVLGYAALLRRLRAADDTVYAPAFRREIEEPIAGAIAVPPEVPLVVTEGNYLLLETPPWQRVRPLLDECWYVDVDDAQRTEWLVQRAVPGMAVRQHLDVLALRSLASMLEQLADRDARNHDVVRELVTR